MHGINSHHNIISDIFEGYITQTISCDNCKTTTYSVSPFLELTVQIPIKEDGNIISGAWHSVNRMLGTATPIPLIDCLYIIYNFSIDLLIIYIEKRVTIILIVLMVIINIIVKFVKRNKKQNE